MHASTTTAVSEGAFASLFQELHDPAFLVDRVDGNFLAANQAAARLLGYSLDDLATLSPSDLHPHELPRLKSFLQEVTTHGRWQDDNLTCRCRDGSFVPAEARATTLHVQGRDCILIQLRDLRGQKLADVGQSVRKLSHDLRNAMTTAQLLADRLAENDDAQVRKSADVIARSLERAITMCQQTIDAGQIASEAPCRERFLLADVVEEVTTTVVMPSGLGTQVVMDDADEDATVLDADFDQIYRILLNLVRNAAEAGAQTVRIYGARDDGRANLTITDDGPGLPDSIRENLKREKPDLSEGSSGLGLMICCELAARHGGAMSVMDSGPKGSRFRVTIPDAV